MKDAFATVARLRRLVDALPKLGQDGEWHVEGLRRWLDRDVDTLEEALGLGAGWRAQDRRQRRDDLIRQLGELEGGSSIHARATAIRRALTGYMTTAWRYQRNLATLPQSAPERRRLLHQILQLDPAPPTSIRQISTILSICNPEPLQLQARLGDL